MSTVTTTFQLTVQDSTAPSWFPSTALQWVELTGAKPADTGVWFGNMRDTTPSSLLLESGATVDHTLKRMMMVANGGHGDGYGNEGYELDLLADPPSWYRLNDRTPEYDPADGITLWIDPAYNNDGAYGTSTDMAVYGDGRPRALHTASTMQFANGKVWWAFQTSYASNIGSSRARGVSYNVATCRAYREAQGAPLPWQAGLGPWADLGATAGYDGSSLNSNYAFGPSVLDSDGNMWWVPKGAKRFVKVNTSTGQMSDSGVNAWGNMGESWAFLIPGADPDGQGGDLLVTHKARTTPADPNVYVLRLSKVSSDPANARASYSTNANDFEWGSNTYQYGYEQNWGAVWHRASNSALVYNNDRRTTAPATSTWPIAGWNGRKMRRLKPPLVNGVLNEGGSWVWTEIEFNAAGATPVRGEHDYGTFGRFNLVKDFDGPGNDALVLLTRPDYPTYVARLPNGDF